MSLLKRCLTIRSGRVLADVRRRVPATSGERAWPPAFFGMGVDKDDRADISQSVDEVIAGGFGAPRSGLSATQSDDC